MHQCQSTLHLTMVMMWHEYLCRAFFLYKHDIYEPECLEWHKPSHKAVTKPLTQVYLHHVKGSTQTIDLTHWGRDKMANIFQMTFANAFSSMKMYEFWLGFHWRMFLRIQLTIFQHLFRKWLGADQATSHYLNQWWSSLLTDIYGITWPQWVNTSNAASLKETSFHVKWSSNTEMANVIVVETFSHGRQWPTGSQAHLTGSLSELLMQGTRASAGMILT